MVVPQNRRSFLAMLGLAPLFAAAPVTGLAAEKVEAEAKTSPVQVDNPNNLFVIRLDQNGQISNLAELFEQLNKIEYVSMGEGTRWEKKSIKAWLPEEHPIEEIFKQVLFWGEVKIKQRRHDDHPCYHPQRKNVKILHLDIVMTENSMSKPVFKEMGWIYEGHTNALGQVTYNCIA